MKMISHYKDLY